LAIDVGSAAVERSTLLTAGYTSLSKTNPANASGTITAAEIYVRNEITGCYVGLFFLVSGTTYECRSSHNWGTIAAGSKQTVSGLTLAVVADDISGEYHSGGDRLYQDSTGGSGVGYQIGEYIDTPGDQTNQEFAWASGESSLWMTGTEAAGGWGGEYCGVAVDEFDGVTPDEIDGV